MDDYKLKALQGYQGSLLPFSRTNGENNFDSNAGIFGAIKMAITDGKIEAGKNGNS